VATVAKALRTGETFPARLERRPSARVCHRPTAAIVLPATHRPHAPTPPKTSPPNCGKPSPNPDHISSKRSRQTRDPWRVGVRLRTTCRVRTCPVPRGHPGAGASTQPPVDREDRRHRPAAEDDAAGPQVADTATSFTPAPGPARSSRTPGRGGRTAKRGPDVRLMARVVPNSLPGHGHTAGGLRREPPGGSVAGDLPGRTGQRSGAVGPGTRAHSPLPLRTCRHNHGPKALPRHFATVQSLVALRHWDVGA
jgi:hypothetical protein